MDTNVSVGATVSFLVYASTTNPPMTRQWQHEGTNVPGATNATLLITNVTVAHSGGYVAWVTNASGSFTNSRTAILTVDPTFTQIMTGPPVTDTLLEYGNASWIDYDVDGNLDLSVAPGELTLKVIPLYHNEGNGTFRKVTTNAIGQTLVRPWALVWGDYDNDGKVDLFVPNEMSSDVLFHNDGNGSFTRITGRHPVIDGADSEAGIWGDYDRDGFLDLFVATWGSCPGQNDILYRNNGDETFRRMTLAEVGPIVSDGRVSSGPAWVDVDNDGWPELYRSVADGCASNWSFTNQGYHIDSQGKFYPMDIGEMKMGTGGSSWITWADFDNDGFLDALVSVWSGLLGLYRNLSGQGFTNVAASAFPSAMTNCWGYWAGDYDNDGWLDLVLYPRGPELPTVYQNNGDGTFTSKEVGGPTSQSGFHYWGDYNNDGFLDVLVQYPGTRNRLFRNNGNTNHWLKVKLDGRASNRSGIGAKVRVNATIGGTNFWQMREICGQGINLDNGLLAHFGLGDATNVTTLRIEWPSGIIQELPNVTANQFLTVVESQGYGGIRPSFTGATKDASGSQLSFTEPAAGARYILEASTDLVNWTKLMARTSIGVATNYTDTRATNYTSRYYRLQVP